MLKYLSAVGAAVLLSVSVMLGLIHTVTPISDTQIRLATRTVEGKADMFFFGEPISMPVSCSATAIAPNIALSAAHCDAADLHVDGLPAKVIKKDEKSDLLLMYVEGMPCPCVPVSDVVAEAGTRVTSMGYPFGGMIGFVLVKNEGIVQGKVKGNPDAGTDRIEGYLVSRLSLEGGNSGGGIFALVNGKWALVSVVSLASTSLSISPSTEMVKEFTKNVR
jgi:hypothetical protein